MRFVKVARESEVPDDRPLAVEAQGAPIALVRLDGCVYAFADVCTHERTPLSEGFLEGDVIECARHGARFDVRTGKVLSLPATSPLKTYPVHVQGGNVLVGVDEGSEEEKGEAS